MARNVMLGGEIAKRGLFGGSRSGLDYTILALGLALGIAVLYSYNPGTLVSVVLGAVVFAFTWLISWPIDIYLNGNSLMSAALIWMGRRARRAAGQNVFIPEHLQREPNTEPTDVTKKQNKVRGSAERKRRMIRLPFLSKKQTKTTDQSNKASSRQHKTRRTPNSPVSVGPVRWFEFETSAGRMVILKHMQRRSRKTKTYFTVTLEVKGTGGGLMREYEADRPYIGFGKFLARVATKQSLVSGIQEISRSLPIDMTDHIQWIKSRISADAPEIVVRSYGELIDQVSKISEQHRSFFVLKIPQSAEFRRRAAIYGRGDEADARAIFDEVKTTSNWARSSGAVKSVRALDETRLAALIRSLQDPSFDMDDTFSYISGNDEALTLNDCWQRLDWSKGPALVVNDTWHHRIGYVPPDAFTAEETNVRALKGLISADREKSFIRSISIMTNLYEAKTARRWAVSDVASDRSTSRQKRGKVSDGTKEVLLTASQRRLKDLKPGSTHQGAGYGIYFTVSAKNAAELEAAKQLMEARANLCGIERIDWIKDEQDTALVAALPFARGLAE